MFLTFEIRDLLMTFPAFNQPRWALQPMCFGEVKPGDTRGAKLHGMRLVVMRMRVVHRDVRFAHPAPDKQGAVPLVAIVVPTDIMTTMPAVFESLRAMRGEVSFHFVVVSHETANLPTGALEAMLPVQGHEQEIFLKRRVHVHQCAWAA